MKLQSTCYSLIGLVGLLCLQAGLPSQAAADEIGKDCHPAPPLRFKSNKQLSNKLLKGKAFFTKNLSADAVFKSFEILPYQDYQEKYGDIGTRCDTSLNRMVAVLVVDYPKGLFSRVVYSKATATSVYDGQIGESLMFGTTGDMIAGGPSFLWDLHQQPKDNSSTTTPKSQLKNSTVDSGVKAIGSPATIYKSTEQMFGDADLVVVGKFSNEKIIVSFEILTAKKFMKKEPQIGILCDTSLNRQIAVLIVDYPKGYSNGFTDFSKARVTYLFDAQTGGNISDSTSGTPIGGGGPHAVYPSKKKV